MFRTANSRTQSDPKVLNVEKSTLGQWVGRVWTLLEDIISSINAYDLEQDHIHGRWHEICRETEIQEPGPSRPLQSRQSTPLSLVKCLSAGCGRLCILAWCLLCTAAVERRGQGTTRPGRQETNPRLAEELDEIVPSQSAEPDEESA